MRANITPIRGCPTLHPNPFPHPVISLSFPLSNLSPLLRTKYLFSLTREMAEQSESTRFQALFDSALQAYERKTGVTLAQHPLAVQIQSCQSVEDMTSLLEGEARTLGDSRQGDRIMQPIKTIVSILTRLSDAASLADALSPVCPVRSR
jgi:hypothetical protein